MVVVIVVVIVVVAAVLVVVVVVVVAVEELSNYYGDIYHFLSEALSRFTTSRIDRTINELH